MEADRSAAQGQLVREAFGRCSPSACWSVWGDLARGGITDRKAWDYPIGHLQRLAAELSVIFGQQAPERLREVGVDDARIERLKEALNDASDSSAATTLLERMDEGSVSYRSVAYDLANVLEDIASGDWQRYPNRERHGQTSVRDYAKWVLEHGA